MVKKKRIALDNPKHAAAAEVRLAAAPGDSAIAIAAMPRSPDTLLLLGFLCSGVAALGLELIWMRILGLAFGSESFGMLGVLAGFFAGLALGAALLHRTVLRSRRPVLVYIVAETVIAAYALTGPLFMLPLAEIVPRLLGPMVGDNRSLAALSLNLLIAMVILLPATVCMGATTVALIEAWRRRRSRAANDNTVAWLYAVNTLGATLGIVLCMYWLLPTLGVQTASGVLGGFSLAAAALAWRWDRIQFLDGTDSAMTPRRAVTEQPSDREPPDRLTLTGYSRPQLYALLFSTGLAGIGLETIGTHVLSQIFENTVHTFANILAVYLLGTAIGAWLYATQRVRGFLGERDRGTSLLLYGLVLAGVTAAVLLAQSAALMSILAPPGSPYARRMLAETVITALIFLSPTLLMGATFSHLLGHFTFAGAGYASAFNTVGAALAPFLFGLVLIPLAGYGVAFYTAIGIYFVLFIAASLPRLARTRWVIAGIVVAAGTGVLTYSSLVLVQFPGNVRVLAQRVGLQGVVSVIEQSAFNSTGVAPRVLQVDQKYLMGGSPGLVTKRMGHLPLLLTPAPKSVLYLGVGTGITAGAALAYPVERVTAVELLPEILDMLPWFKDDNHGLERDQRVALHASDARRFVLATRDTYDVIVADLYHPSRDGTGSLYTVEHYNNIRGRLRDGGLFVQWLPLYQLYPEDLKTIVRTFVAVFPDAHSMIGNYSGNARFALLSWIAGSSSTASRLGVDVARTQELLRKAAGNAPVFDGIHDLLSSYMLDVEGLKKYAGPGPLNTDTNQRIVFDAAGAVRIEDSADTQQSLATLLPFRRPFPDEFIRSTDNDTLSALRRDVRPFADAVTHYLAGEIARLKAPPDSVPAAAVAAYLKAYEADIRFTLAIGKLLELALQHPASTKEIVQKIWLAHTEQPNISALRRRLEGIEAPAAMRAIVSRFLQTGGD